MSAVVQKRKSKVGIAIPAHKARHWHFASFCEAFAMKNGQITVQHRNEYEEDDLTLSVVSFRAGFAAFSFVF
jgi:hypothetical protein